MNQVYLAKTLFEAHYAGVGFLYETAKQEAAAPGPCAHRTLNQSTWRAWAECSLQEIRAPESVPGEKSLQDGKREGKTTEGEPTLAVPQQLCRVRGAAEGGRAAGRARNRDRQGSSCSMRGSCQVSCPGTASWSLLGNRSHLSHLQQGTNAVPGVSSV